MHDTLCRKAHGDRGADFDLALQVQGTAVQLHKGLGERQTKASALMAPVHGAVDLAERREGELDVPLGDTDPGQVPVSALVMNHFKLVVGVNSYGEGPWELAKLGLGYRTGLALPAMQQIFFTAKIIESCAGTISFYLLGEWGREVG